MTVTVGVLGSRYSSIVDDLLVLAAHMDGSIQVVRSKEKRGRLLRMSHYLDEQS